jgi:hypothetical protein
MIIIHLDQDEYLRLDRGKITNLLFLNGVESIHISPLFRKNKKDTQQGCEAVY